MLTGDWRLHDLAKLTGTWTNNGTLRGQSNLDNKLGSLDAGAHFTNNGTLIGNGLRLIGNDLSADPDEVTRLVNHGTLDLDGGGIFTSGVAASYLVNHGVLQNNDAVGGRSWTCDSRISARCRPAPAARCPSRAPIPDFPAAGRFSAPEPSSEGKVSWP